MRSTTYRPMRAPVVSARFAWLASGRQANPASARQSAQPSKCVSSLSSSPPDKAPCEKRSSVSSPGQLVALDAAMPCQRLVHGPECARETEVELALDQPDQAVELAVREAQALGEEPPRTAQQQAARRF